MPNYLLIESRDPFTTQAVADHVVLAVGLRRAGNAVTLSDEQSFADYEAELYRVPGLKDFAAKAAKSRPERALAAEMILEGLHQHLKLARQDLDSQISYKEMVKFQLLRPRRGGSSRDRGDVN